MFEFHGWAVIRHTLAEDDIEGEQGRVLHDLRELIASLDSKQRFFHLGDSRNMMDSITVSGLRNHREDEIIAVFQWLVDHAPGSYGLLYVHNDEGWRGHYRYTNVFRVFHLVRGRLEELDDPFLSPVIPTVENACD